MTDMDPTIRWDLIEDLYGSYIVGVCDKDRPEWNRGVDSLSADEREVLAWKIEEGDSAIPLLLKAMKQEGANSFAELGRAKPKI